MVENSIKTMKIKDLDFTDSFFNSLRSDYTGFDTWLTKKGLEEVYVQFDNLGLLTGFLYLKDETESNNLISPQFSLKRRLKVGTFKILAHGTTLGQHFIRIILTEMLKNGHDFAYVTVFDKQRQLIDLFVKFGFQQWGTNNNGELIFFKDLTIFNDIYKDFPRINISGSSKQYLLAIKPVYHTKMFPDSKLNTERTHVVQDLSVTNTCEKIYISSIPQICNLVSGDNLVIYRTAEEGRPAEYSSVASTICTVKEVRNINSFRNKEDFIKYCSKGSVFTVTELKKFWENQYPKFIIKMLYNVSLSKRLTRNKLINEVGIERNQHWSCIELSIDQFQDILEMGEVCESFIID
ncbi:hypothetical protein P7H30_07595 [Streptococcus parauberis]|uniref:hypothetical protein n=1 Tax=Streptococcus parauberis TaxID=1348 RepID=UPI0028912F36|nr:hypothetical protein [Streptococcus parauberis]MDT2749602.1 hypothetical protein [Streptococcus parauberis]